MTWPFENYCGRTHADIGKQRGLIRQLQQSHYYYYYYYYYSIQLLTLVVVLVIVQYQIVAVLCVYYRTVIDPNILKLMVRYILTVDNLIQC